jgi:hypothetical protein
MSKFIFITLRLAILIAILFTAFPAQAAGTPDLAGWKGKCVCLYPVDKGETLTQIARLFGISAQEIADANGISTSTKLKNGQILCIPRVAFKLAFPKAQLSGSVALKRLYIEGGDFPKLESYSVRIRARNQTTWTRIGVLRTDKNGEFERNFRIPNIFQDVRRFEVCLKHTLKGYTVCTFAPRVW